MKKILSLIVFLVFMIFAQPAFAANLDIECFGTGTGTCTKTGQDPLFSQALDGYWMPGDSASKTFKIINSAAQTREVFMKPLRTSAAGIIENVIEISLTPTGGGTPNWNGILTDFYNLGNFSLGNVSSGGNIEYVIYARMKPEADNSYQGESTKFDLDFSFWVEEVKQNFGGPGDGLSDGKSDGRSDGMGGFVSTVQPLLQQALGLQTEEISEVSPIPTPTTAPKEEGITKEAKGAKTPCDNCIWWQILLGEMIALFIYYKYMLKKPTFNKKYFIPLIIPLLTYIIFVILNRDCPNYIYIFCKYFWLLDLGIYLVWKKNKKEESSEKPQKPKKPQKHTK